MSALARPPRDRKPAHRPFAPEQLDAVAALFGVLSEPSRLLILQRLQRGPASVGELVEALGMKQANVSKQLGILQSAGVLSRTQDGNRAIYSIDMPLVLQLCELVCHGVARHARTRARRLSQGTRLRSTRR